MSVQIRYLGAGILLNSRVVLCRLDSRINVVEEHVSRFVACEPLLQCLRNASISIVRTRKRLASEKQHSTYDREAKVHGHWEANE